MLERGTATTSRRRIQRRLDRGFREELGLDLRGERAVTPCYDGADPGRAVLGERQSDARDGLLPILVRRPTLQERLAGAFVCLTVCQPQVQKTVLCGRSLAQLVLDLLRRILV